MLKYISNCNTSFVTPVYRKIKKKKENIKYSFPHSCALTLHAKKTSIKTEKNKTLRTGRAPSRPTSQSLRHKKQIDAFTSEPGANKKKKKKRSGALLSLFSPVKSGSIYSRYAKKPRVLKFAFFLSFSFLFLLLRSSTSHDLSATYRLCFAQIAATQ